MLEAGHYILLALIYIIIGWGLNKASKNAEFGMARRAKLLRGYATVVLLWTIYVLAVSSSGLIASFEMPPRMPLFIILPAFSIIIWFFVSKKFKEIRDHFPIEFTVYYQSFRIFVELLILGLYYKGIGPELVTFEGRNFDILAGISAPVIGYMAYSKKWIGYKVVIAWNICCLLLLANIVYIFLTLAFRPDTWGYTTTPISIDFTKSPYIFIAAVFMPTAVFMHIFSLNKTLAAMKGERS